MLLGKNVLLGDFAAILASAVMAIYITYSKDVIKEERCPLSITLTMIGCYVICLSFAFAYISGQPINIFSMDKPDGLLCFLKDG